MRMEWEKLLSAGRLGKQKSLQADVRSQYQRDFDRIVFSSAFRRLQDKTQVFPLAASDYVRTRLTHSIEVASVGRSLGALIGELIDKKKELPPSVHTDDLGSIVAAACLAHDIGNPPFGHSGEDAIAEWFKTAGNGYLKGLSEQQKTDLTKFEGNAQGFRILTKLQSPSNTGGMQLTYATLGAFTKYPKASFVKGMDDKKKKNEGPVLVSEKKFGFVADDQAHFDELATELGLIKKRPGAWARHPLAFLVEAADDICYRIIDFEDGCRVGRVPQEQAAELLGKIVKPEDRNWAATLDKKSRIEYLRARAISKLIYQAVEVFEDKYKKIMEGKYEEDLISNTESFAVLGEIEEISRELVYGTPSVREIEAAGFGVLGGLLELVVPTFLAGEEISKSQKKLRELVPSQYLGKAARYDRLLSATDFVSGMTDSYALSLYKKLKGIELPRG